MVGWPRSRNRGGSGGPVFLGHLDAFFPKDYYYYAPYQEDCFDELHRWPPGTTGPLFWDQGGPLLLQRTRILHSPSASLVLTNGLGGSLKNTYSGNFIAGTLGSNPSLPGHLSGLTAGQLTAYGSEGWAKFKPGKPVVDVGQFLGELRQLPRLPLHSGRLLNNSLHRLIGKHSKTAKTGKARSASFRDLGSEYLNIEFGWKPFVRDIIGMLDFNSQVSTLLAQLRRDNGNTVRRRGTVDLIRSESVSQATGTFLYPVLPSQFYRTSTNSGDRLSITRTSTRVTFSGQFRYWIPDLDTPEGERRAIRRLLGLRLTPGLVWELTPWSWLIDWFANIGAVLDNLSANAAENLAANYAYVMAQTVESVTHHEQARFRAGLSANASVTRERTTKQRQAASPFGFGLTSASLSDKQKLILGALGISRYF